MTRRLERRGRGRLAGPAAMAGAVLAGALGLVVAAPAGAELGGQRLHITAVTTGAQPDGNAVKVDLACTPALEHPPSTLYFYGPGDQDINAQGMAECSLVVVAPKDSTSLAVRCVASGEATCVSDRAVRGAGQYLVTFTITTAFSAVATPPSTASLPPAVPPTQPGAGGPPSTTSGAPLPTDPPNAADPANPANPQGDGSSGSNGAATGATNGTGSGSETATGQPTAAGGAGTTVAGADGASGGTTTGTGGSASGTAGAAAPSGATAPAADEGRSSFAYLAVLLVVLACVAGGALGGASLRRRLTPPDPEHPVGSAGTEGALAPRQRPGTAPDAPGVTDDA